MWKTPSPRRPHKRVAELDAVIEVDSEALVAREAIDEVEEMGFET